MKNTICILFLITQCFCFSQEKDRVYYHKVEPYEWYQRTSEGDIFRYTHNELELKVYDQSKINVQYGGNLLLDWSYLDSNPYPAIYYNKVANSYFVFFEVDMGGFPEYTIYSVTPSKVEYLGYFDPNDKEWKQYLESGNYKNKDWCNGNYITVYTVNDTLNIVETTAGGNEFLPYRFVKKSGTAAQTVTVPEGENLLSFPEPAYFEKVLDLDSDGITEKYGIWWDKRAVSYIDDAAANLALKSDEKHIYFINDTLVITDKGKLPSAANIAAYSTSFQFFKPVGYQEPVLVKTIYELHEPVFEEAVPFRINCKTEKLWLSDLYYSPFRGTYDVIDEYPEYDLDFLVKYSAFYNHTYEQLPLIAVSDICKIVQKNSINSTNLESYTILANNLLKVPQSMADNMKLKFGEWKDPWSGLYSSIFINNKILEIFPDFGHGYLAIADAYWIMRNSNESLHYYNLYLSFVKKDKKPVAIPQRVFDRINKTDANKK